MSPRKGGDGEGGAAEGRPRRYRLLACEVLYREACQCAARSAAIVDVEFVSQGYHDLPSGEMCRRLQEQVAATDAARHDAVLLGFALCNNGIAGLRAYLTTQRRDAFVRQFCERTLWLHQGKQMAFGPTADVLPRYEAFGT